MQNREQFRMTQHEDGGNVRQEPCPIGPLRRLVSFSTQLRALSDRVFRTFGRIAPLYFLLTYLVLIPFFAGLYLALPLGSFVAPYAKSEPGAAADSRALAKIFETVIAAHLQSLEDRRAKDHAGGLPDQSWRVFPDKLMLEKVNIVDDTIRMSYRLRMSQGNEEAIFPVLPIIIQSHRVTNTDGSDNVLVDIRYDADAIISKPLSSYVSKYNIFESLPIASLPHEDRERVANYIDGYGGDPVAFSDKFARMFYFSVIVITTVGFGDIVPMTDRARALVAFEAMAGIMVAGLFINSIAALAARPPKRRVRRRFRD